jgi:holo-[acyl-carrier protein] synthase
VNIPAGIFVLGLGSDLCNIDRIENSITRFGDRFLDRVFTHIERAKADRRLVTRTATFAKRFAAKEACSKALGTGFRQGVFMKDMGVVNLASGAPTMALAGGAAVRLAQITPAGHKAAIHLTITDDHPWAQAIVLITASPL